MPVLAHILSGVCPKKYGSETEQRDPMALSGLARLATETEIKRGREKTLGRVVNQRGNRGEMFLYFIVLA